MMRWLSVVCALLAKEWALEWRGRELVTLLGCNALMMSVLIGAGVSGAMLDASTTSKLYPMFLWVVFILAVTASLARINEQELEARGFEGLLLAGATSSQIFVSKVISTWVVLFLTYCLTAGTLGLALNQNIVGLLCPLFLIGAAVSVALAALIVLLGGVSGSSRMRGVLLPVLTIPLCFPLFFAGIEMSAELVLRGAVDLSGPWPSIVVCAEALYIVLGLNLYEYVITE